MGIYIPDIKLPKDEPGAFQVIVMYVGADKKLRAECEGTHEVTIVPPHGRLIDADAFFKDICDSLNEMTAIGIAVDGEWMWGKLNDALDNAPTIIPAEEGET